MSDMIAREITGAKAGQKQPTRPSIADDTIASISRLKMIIGLSEGEVKGLANGAQSIMLEGTPLEDASGNRNFEGVEWEIRHGTVDQTYIAGMPNASSEVGVGVTVRSDTPWIRSINNTQLSSINVNISFPMLKKVTDKGDVVGVTVDYAIDVQTDGGGYVPVVTKSLTAKTSGRYQRTHNVTLPEAQSNWQIRVRKITTDGDNETLFNTMQIDSIAEIVDGKFNYPHTAHLYLSLDARIFSNIPKVTIDMLGVYVQVPVNYDTETRTSTGIWNGQFKLGYTTNPAWHYYNLITNDRYGLGDKLQPFMIDKWSLEHIARICDERVDDGKGGTEPRFECNLYLQKAEDAYQVLQHIAGIFRGMSFWNGSKIFVDADTPRDCEYVITRANVIGGHFSKSGSAASDRHTIAQVAWSNPANSYETEYVMVRNERAIAQQGINVLDLSAVGCTSEGQAYRMGLAALLAEQNRTQTVSFSMGLDGSLPTVGSRIDIPDMMFTGANNGGRISSVNTNRTIITVDRDNVPATVGDKLIVNLESGKAQTRVITAVNGRAITVALAFDPVAPENVWSVVSDELPTMPFIVMSVTSAEDGTQYNYTALQYDPSMYAQIDNGTIIEQRPPVPSNNPYIIDAPEAVTLGSRHRVEQGITITTLEITWSQVKDAVAYDVEWRKDDGDWIKLPRTGNISAEVDGVYSGNYLARVRAVSAFDAISKPNTSMLTEIKGKVGLPPTVVGLTATGILFGMDLKWGFANGSGDAAFTEIQVGSAPDVNVATLTQVSYPTNTHTVTGLQGNLSQSYRARLVDKLGFVSPWSAWVTSVTDANADKVMDLIEGQIRESSLNTILTTKIADIEINKGAISKETQDRINDIIEANRRIDGVISNADVEYYLSTSATTPTGGVWQTTAPAWQQGRYMFSRTKLMGADGTIKYNPSVNGVNITGAKGDKGEQGIPGRDGANGIDGINGVDGLEGPQGNQGVPGPKGADGLSSYTHLAYATSSTGAGFSTSHYPNATYIGMYVDNVPTDSAVPSKYKWSLIKGADGANGVAGQKGADGLTPYFHVAYATNATGTQGFSTTESLGKTYIGQYTDYTLADSNDPAKYKWTLIKGADGKDGLNGVNGLEGPKGEQGIPGAKGADGLSSYTHLAYATSATGGGFSKFHFANATYIGMYVDNIAADSDNPAKYKWNLIKGADGTQGIPGAKGADGLTPYFHVAYANSADGTVGFSTTVSTGKAYIGQYTDNIAADSTSPSRYKWTLIKGATGDTGQGVDSIVEQYGVSRSETVAPTVWTETSPTVTKGDYVWTRSKITYKNPVEVQYTTPIVSPAWSAISEFNTEFINFQEDTGNEFLAQGERLDGIITDYKPRYTDATRYTDASRSQQWTYWKTVAADNYAANDRITNLQSEFASSNANVTKELFTLAEKDKSIAADITQLYINTGENYGLIQDIDIAISTPNTGLAAKVTELESSVKTPENLAALVEGSGAFSDEFGSISGNFANFQAVVDGQKTAIETVTAVGNAEKLKNEIAKARLDKNVTSLNAQSTALTTQINGYTAKVTDLTAKRDATPDTALKAEYNRQIAEINAAKTDLTAQRTAITAQVTQLNSEKEVLDSLVLTETDVKAQHTIKIDAGGKIVGYGLVVQKDNFSTFDVRADRFGISAPVGKPNDVAGTSPFMVLTNPQVIDGVSVPAGVYMRQTYIAKASIDLAQIKTASITKLSALSSDLGEVTAGSININDKFVVDKFGNILAKSGTFEGTVLAEKISGTIDIESMKRSAWTPAYKVYVSNVYNVGATPASFDKLYGGSHVSYGSINAPSTGYGGQSIGSIMYEIDVVCANPTVINQSVEFVDDVVKVYVNGVLATSTSSRKVISYNLPAGLSKIQILNVNNSAGEIGMLILGDFIDNVNVKFA